MKTRRFPARRAASLFLAALLAASCAGGPYRPLTARELAEVEVLATEELVFRSNTGALDGAPTLENHEEAYLLLLRKARASWPDRELDVRNVRVYTTDPGASVNVELHATGDVVATALRPSGQSGQGAPAQAPGQNAGIEQAASRTGGEIVRDLPEHAVVAVLSVSSNNYDIATYVVDELLYLLVSSRRFQVVDRQTLDTIRAEQRFQLSGEVDDASAVSIGRMLGANIVITGAVTGAGPTRRLVLRALDVTTARIVSMAREAF